MSNDVKLGLMAALGAFLLVGCGGDAVDLGDNAGNESGLGQNLDGVWVGTLSGEAVLSPKPVRLTIDQLGPRTLLVGAAALPAPSDPSVGYPPEAQADAAEASGMLTHLYDGVTYALENVRVSGKNLHFKIDLMSAFEPWCALQTPVSGGRCRENWGGGVDRSSGEKRCFVINPDTGEHVPEDCLALFLCSFDPSKGCFCSATACAASNGGIYETVTFDLVLDPANSILEGTYTFGDDSSLSQPVLLSRED